MEFIRKLPCITCHSAPRSQAAHIRYGNDGGAGMKPSDCYVVPMCAKCHYVQHQDGELTFWYPFGGYERANVYAKKLYENTGDKLEAISNIVEFRKCYTS